MFTTFTEKIQTRAYTIDDVVGTIGGYVGLFMGYAVVQFPNIIRSRLLTFQEFGNLEYRNGDIPSDRNQNAKEY